ncbi:MAG: hypothetical protein IIT70_04805 [Clostridia bacterium]|nr:hypothetical protein [Clostridia bacterium]
MSEIIKVIVQNNTVYVPYGAEIVSDNTKYAIQFLFDDEWSSYKHKTARFVIDGEYTDVDFSGDLAAVHCLSPDTDHILVGCYITPSGGGFMTTTAGRIPVRASVLGDSQTNASPYEPGVIGLASELDEDDTVIVCSTSGGVYVKATLGQLAALTGAEKVSVDQGAANAGKVLAVGQDGEVTLVNAGANGKSAYELAVDNGFSGTEAEWLTSLKGAAGSTPVRGVDYMTSEDISSIAGAAASGAASQLQPGITALSSAVAAKADKAAEVTVPTAGAVTQALDAGKIYHFTGSLTSLTLTLNAAASGETAQYHFDFTAGASAPTLTLPNAVSMPDGWSVDANTRYEVDILNGYGVAAGWAVSA